MLDSVSSGGLGEAPRPLTEKDFRTNFMNRVGEVTRPRELRLAVYQTGADPALRKVLWKHLLGVYPEGKEFNSQLVNVTVLKLLLVCRSHW